MKNILILNKYTYSALPYDQFLNDFDGNIILFTSKETVKEFQDTNFFKEVIGFDDFRQNSLVEYYAHKYNQRYNFENVIVTGESEIITGANIRKSLNIKKGQDISSAISFRDKVVMKEILEGKLTLMSLPKYTRIYSISSILEFANENGYPFVVKARKSMASQNVYVIKNEKDILDLSINLKNEELVDFIAEEFIDLPQYIFDGKIENGELKAYSFSYYNTNPFDLASGESNQGMIINYFPHHKISNLNKKRIKELVNALPFPNNSLFHCEVFYNKQTDEMIFAEIGSRSGGATLPKAFKENTNVSHLIDYIRCELELSTSNVEYTNNWISMVMPYYYSGKITHVPTREELINEFKEQLIDVDTYVHNGEIVNTDLKSTRWTASMIMSIPPETDIDIKSNEILKKYCELLQIDQNKS